jgi:hypothetical protein
MRRQGRRRRERAGYPQPPVQAAPWPSGGRRLPRQVDAQTLQRAGDVADRVDGDAGVERGRF